jgi:tRNA threonylcarbamoyladenosine biosynthesis protein TsaB
MIVLGIETSTRLTSVAIAQDGTVIAVERHDGERSHGAVLAPAVSRCLAAAGIAPVDLDAVAVGVGPGLYTGLRVGMATGAALAAAHGLPTIGVCGLDTLARSELVVEVVSPATGGAAADAPRSVTPGLVTTIDARRGQVFWARYAVGAHGRWSRVDEPRLGDRAALTAELARQGGPVVVGEIAVTEPRWPDAVHLLALAAEGLAAGGGVAPHLLQPVYLREADVRIGWAERGGGRAGADRA